MFEFRQTHFNSEDILLNGKQVGLIYKRGTKVKVNFFLKKEFEYERGPQYDNETIKQTFKEIDQAKVFLNDNYELLLQLNFYERE